MSIIGSRHTFADGTTVELVHKDAVGARPRWWAGEVNEGSFPRLPQSAALLHNMSALYSSHAWVEVEPAPAGPEHGITAADVKAMHTAILTTDNQARKNMPMARGLVDYFPRALAAVANVSFVANEQHNPGQPMHWAKGKSTDHADCIMRHLVERGSVDDDGLRHAAKLAWRALALLETELTEQQ